jgi:EAL domain-containing protein (putative c-di-GMP-specific phosphodiesterase class I)
VLLGDTELALQTLHALRKLGVELAVDDFGTGGSSLAYLTRFPLNRLKIGRSFVTGMSNDTQCAALVGAIIAMAHALRLRVTDEGGDG